MAGEVGLGVLAIMGAARQTAYETEVAATDKVPLLSESLDEQSEFSMLDHLRGSAGMKGQQLIFNPVSGSVEAIVPYTVVNTGKFISTDLLIAAAMGKSTWDGVNGVNQIDLLDRLAEMVTLATDKQVSADDSAVAIIGAMCSSFGFQIDASSPGHLVFSSEWQANQYKYASTTNTEAGLQALPDDCILKAIYPHLTFRIGDHANALTSADDYGITGFNLQVNNALSDASQSTPDATNALEYAHTDGKRPIKPQRSGYREVTLEITLPQYTNDVFRDWKKNETDLQAEINFADDSGSGDYFKILIPQLRVGNPTDPVGGAEAIQPTIPMTLFYPCGTTSDTTYEDGTAVGQEFGIETKNDRVATILA